MKNKRIESLYPKMDTNYSFNFQRDKSFLAIDTRAGGGHRAAMAALIALIEKVNPDAKVFRLEILHATLTPYFGKKAIRSWNRAKQEGDLEKQFKFISAKYFGLHAQKWGDLLFAPFLFFALLYHLLIKDRSITRILDTQPFGTPAILLAVRLVNRVCTGRNLLISRVMTDPPTEEAVHFSRPVKKLGRKNRAVFELVSICPIPQREGENGLIYIDRQEVWWQKHFNLSLKEGEVKYGPPPLRPPFFSPPDGFSLHPYGEEGARRFLFGSEERLFLIAIGSQAAEEGTIGYVRDLIELMEEKGSFHPTLHIFAYCGGQEDFFHKLPPKNRLPENVKLYAFGEHDAEERAALVRRADGAVYGAGGMTVLEAEYLAEGNIYLHSEAKGGELLEGFALWEKGNAKFLIENKEAQPVTPGELFKAAMRRSSLFFDTPERLPSEEEHQEAGQQIEVPV